MRKRWGFFVKYPLKEHQIHPGWRPRIYATGILPMRDRHF